jgi:PAS domain S-box-containing protein
MGLWESEIGSGLIVADEQAFQLHGLEAHAEPVDRKLLFQRVHRGDRAQVRALTADALAKGNAFNTEFRIALRRGDVRWLGARGRRLPNTGRRPARLLCVVLDITEQKRAEEMQRRMAEQADDRSNNIEVIYNAAHVGLCILDRELRYVRVNRLLAEMNGLAPEAHIGKTIREVTPDLAPKAELVAREVLRTGQPVLDVEFSGTTRAHGDKVRHWIGQ